LGDDSRWKIPNAGIYERVEEFSQYHRKDGRIVKANGDLASLML